MMKKIAFFLAGMALIISACSGSGVETTDAVSTPEGQLQPTQAATEESMPPAATVASASTPQSSGLPATGTAVFVLVPEESTVTYEVAETFLDGNVLNIAVGKTSGVTGEIQADYTNPQNSTVGTLSVDITGLTSDSGRRDNAIRDRFLESRTYPTVTFIPNAIEGLPAEYQEGTDYPIKISGELTIRDVTKPATFDAVIRLENGTLTGQATTMFLMSEYGFGPISIMGMLNTEDEVKITVDFTARPQ